MVEHKSVVLALEFPRQPCGELWCYLENSYPGASCQHLQKRLWEYLTVTCFSLDFLCKQQMTLVDAFALKLDRNFTILLAATMPFVLLSWITTGHL